MNPITHMPRLFAFLPLSRLGIDRQEPIGSRLGINTALQPNGLATALGASAETSGDNVKGEPCSVDSKNDHIKGTADANPQFGLFKGIQQCMCSSGSSDNR